MKRKRYISLFIFVGAIGFLTFFGFYDPSVVSNFSKPSTSDLFEETDSFAGDIAEKDCTIYIPVKVHKEAVINDDDKEVESVKQINFTVSKSKMEQFVENTSLKKSPSNASINLFIEQYEVNKSDSIEMPFLFTYDSYTAVLKKTKNSKDSTIRIQFREEYKETLDSQKSKAKKSSLQCRNSMEHNKEKLLPN